MDDIFAIQDEISGAIVTALQGKLGVEIKAPSVGVDTKNMEAYQLFLKARQLILLRGLDNLLEARVLLETAIDLDPNFARAIGYVAYIMHTLPLYNDIPPNYGLMFHLVDRALKLDPNLPIALMVKGILTLQIYNDPLEAISLLERAVLLVPQDPNTQLYSGYLFSVLGYKKKVLGFAKKAYELAPTNYMSFQYGFQL